MGSGPVLCKYVLQDGLWDFLFCSLLSSLSKHPWNSFRTSNTMSTPEGSLRLGCAV